MSLVHRHMDLVGIKDKFKIYEQMPIFHVYNKVKDIMQVYRNNYIGEDGKVVLWWNCIPLCYGDNTNYSKETCCSLATFS